MFNNLTELIIKADKILFVAAVALALATIIFAAARESVVRRRVLNLEKIKKNLQRMVRADREKIEETIPVFVDEFSPQQFSLLSKEDYLKLSPGLEQEIKDNFISSGKLEAVEQMAHKGRDKWDRVEALITLGYINSPATLGILQRSLLDRDEDINYFALQALGQLKSQEAAKVMLDFLAKNPHRGYGIALLLEAFPATISAELYEAAASQYGVVRYWAVKLIGKFKARDYLPRIEGLTADSNSDVRAAACECLGLLEDKEAGAVIKTCLKDKLWFVRMHAVRALDLIMGATALPDALPLIDDPAAKVREGVKNILARNIQQALPYLEKYLFSHDQAVRRCCAEALVDAGYIPVILKDILSEDPDVEQKAMRLLAGLVKSRIYFGLKRALEDLSVEEKNRVLLIVAAMDQGLAERIKQENK